VSAKRVAAEIRKQSHLKTLLKSDLALERTSSKMGDGMNGADYIGNHPSNKPLGVFVRPSNWPLEPGDTLFSFRSCRLKE
jgi:hypothetical protein